MNKKEIFTIILLISVVFSLQAVVAADSGLNSTDTIKATQDLDVVKSSNVSAYSLPNTNDVLQDGSENAVSFSDLQNVINNNGANFADHNYTWDSSKDSSITSGIIISNLITLDGQGKVIIDAQGKTRMFVIDSGVTVTLKGITFINGNTDGNGGSILSNGILTIDSCNFINNTAGGHGGAIYLDHSTSSTIKGSTFTDNVAGLNGGAVDWHAGSTNGKLLDSTFTNNTAKRSGGAIHWSGHNGTISNTNFTNNNATGDVVSTIGGILGGGDGGAVIWVGSHGIINNNCIFINNTAKYRGGAIFLHGNSTEDCINVTVDDCTFKYNYAGLNGGAIDWQKGSSDGILTNSIFINNTAERNGGAIFWYGHNGTISNCDFINNSATNKTSLDDRVNESGVSIGNYIDTNGNLILGGSGGAIVWTGDVGLIDNCNFTYNTAVALGGSIYLRDNSNTIVKNSNFTNNTAGVNGGAIDFNRGAHDGIIDNCTFTNNIANRSAGAIFWFGTNGTIQKSTFTNNRALGNALYTDSYGNLTYGGYGGAVIWTGANGIIDECRFIDNNASKRGGAVYLQGSNTGNCTNTTFKDSIFISNYAGTNGGAVDWHEGASEGNIFNCTFQHNIAESNGGGVYWRGHNGEIIDSNFTNNTARGLHSGTYGNFGDGGAVFWAGSNGTVDNCRFIDNRAQLNNATATDGGNGGAVYLEPCEHGDVDVSFTNSYFRNNTADSLGGAVAFAVGAVNCTISSSNFTENYARIDGGAINFAVGSLYNYIKDSRFDNNSAGDDGGAINWEGNVGIIQNITCYNNTGKSVSDTGRISTSNGGTICLTGNNITISDSSFELSTVLSGSNNDKVPYGGAIFLTGNYNNIINTAFDSCYCPNDAGAIYIIGNYTLIDKCTFENCTTPENGGVMFILGDYCNLYNSTFTNNLAGNDGGAINWEGNHGIVYNITCINNRAVSMNGHYSNGGTMDLEGDNITISNSKFSQTSAKIAGGAIFITGNLISIKDSEFSMCNVSLTDEPKQNKAYSTGGGAIYVLGNNTTIENCNFTRNNAKHGGVLYIQGNNVNITNITTDFTFSSQEGGAIFVDGSYTTISDSSFSRANSTQSRGGAIYIGSQKADSGLRTTIKNSKFSMTTAVISGGAVYIKGRNATIDNSTFNLTSAISASGFSGINLGGAVYIEGDYANIAGSNFSNSSAYNGGVIYLKGSYCNVTNSSLDKGYTYGCGGAIYSEGTYSTVYESNFTNNLARNSGGAIFWYGNTDRHNQVLSSLFANNTAIATEKVDGDTRGGGAIYWYKYGHYATVKDSIFINNSVQATDNVDVEGGAMLMDYVNNVIIDNCVFDNNYITTTSTSINSAWIQGGAIYMRPHNLTLQNSVFKNCWSIKEAGAVYVSNSGSGAFRSPYDIIFDNVTFINNTAKSEGQKGVESNSGGGALQVKECKNSLFTNLKFFNNTAYQGGALAFGIKNTDKDYFVNCTFSGNNATTNGGSIYANQAINLENISISDSYAGGYGGGLYVNNAVNYNGYMMFINNTAGNNGGGFYWDRSGVTIKNMLFENNTAANFGGAFYNTGSATFNYNNFTGNTAYQGGAVYVYSSNIEYNNFTNNSAEQGGAVYANQKANVDYNNFTANTAYQGGAIYVNIDDMTLSHNNYTNNSADYGGAICTPMNSNSVKVTYSDFTSNHAYSDGGAIYSGFKLTENNCNFINNTAFRGGAIFIAQSSSTISNSYFDGNNATKSGGAIYVVEYLTGILIEESTFKNSHAGDGGAIYNEGGSSFTTIIKNDIFVNNTAEYNGGAVLYKLRTSNGIVYFRDYNNFDGQGVILSNNRTDVSATAGSSSTKFIDNSLFVNNLDYPFIVETISELESPVITVRLINPNHLRRNNVKFTINLTNSTSGDVIQQIIVDDDNFYSHYNDELSILYVTFDNLRIDTDYNITVGFSDNDYLYKENSTHNRTQGTERGDFQLLQYLIEQAISNGRYVLDLTRSYRFIHTGQSGNILDNGCMNLTNISQPFTINGHGWAIDARGFSRIFNITSSNITFNNVMFIDGNASGECNDGVNIGGAIFWSGTNGTLNECRVENNYAEFGGGIYYNSTATGSKIIGSEFISNTAEKRGGAIDCNATKMELVNNTLENNHAYIGAALCREVNAAGGFGFNNTFTDNHADYAGAALAWMNSSNIHIDAYYFYNNTAGFSGGAIYVGEGSGNCEIENCVFDNNYVDNATGGHGGAIEWYAEQGYVLNSNFTNNHAHDGGAIYVGKESGKINITYSIFKENYAATVGGAVSLNASSITINGSDFYNNTALEGGALYVGGQGETNYVYNSVFEGNNATGGNGGAINWMASSGTILNSNLTNNKAYYGGAIYYGGLSEDSIISRCIFTANHAKYNGGAIDCNSSRMNLTHTIFDGNYAQFGAGLCREINSLRGSGQNNTFINNHAYVSGAALGWMNSVGIRISNYTFINNSADISGGAIYIDQDSHNCSILDSNFENNYVTNVTSSGISNIYWTAWDGTPMKYEVTPTSDTSLINKTIIGETITTYYCGLTDDMSALAGIGGAINCLADNATIINTNFTQNSARLGGAVYVGADSGNTNITNDIFTSNSAYERGGAVNLHASAVSVDSSKFYNNRAVDGGALYVGGVGTNNTIVYSVFEGNNATGYGAGVYWIAHEGIIDNSNFTSNAATYGGGIFFNGRSANTNVTNVIFKSNNATKNGGAIECNASNIGIYNLTFTSNYAGEYGAALCRESGATGGHGTNNTFIANHADISGAGLAWLGVDNIHIVDYKFINNTAYRTGAAIYIADDSDNAIIDYCVFTGNRIINSTGGHGGAIDVVGDNAAVINSNFTDNSAYYGGAIWFDEDSGYTNVTNVTFTRNNAAVDGGAINLRGSGISIEDARFYYNIAGRNGGALYAGLTGKTSTIHDSVFENNGAGDHGGAIDWRSAAGEIVNSNFTANTAVYGGAIYLNGVSSNSRILEVIFTENRATKNGGAIDCNASMMGLNNTRFISNYAGEYGAALCREANATGGFGGNNTFILNHADIAGAALAWLGVDGININNYTFINNTADRSGGAIFVREDSPNCKVRNSYFDTNYVTDVRNGHGGSIDWLGSNGLIANSTFESSFAVYGGTIYAGVDSTNLTIFNSSFMVSRALGDGGAIALYSDNANITSSNFTISLALESGGAISGHSANNATINDCIFDYAMGAGYIDATLRAYGEGGAIYWENGRGLNISNSQFLDLRSNSNGGAISAINCNDSTLYNIIFMNEFSGINGGSISWINSTNLTFDLLRFNKTEAYNHGGAIYLLGINDAVIKNSAFDVTRTPWGSGGAIYVDGNVTVDNSTFSNYQATSDYAGAIFFCRGNSTLSNSTFNGGDAIWVNVTAGVHIIKNNITGVNPNKDIYYLEKAYDARYNKVDYSVWNDGDLWLEDNNFDYVIFNNGTIWTKTYTRLIDNETYNVTWNDDFTFFAYISDDNLNTIISVSSLNATTKDLDFGNYLDMPYNSYSIKCIYQGVYHALPDDSGLKNNTVFGGTVNVKMPVSINFTSVEVKDGKVSITAQLNPLAKSNFTIYNQEVTFKLGDETFTSKILNINNVTYDDFITWTIATTNLTLNNLAAGTYTITATYGGDDLHLGFSNSTTFKVDQMDTWIKIAIENIAYGQNATAVITTNSNGTIRFSLSGKNGIFQVRMIKGSDGNYTGKVNITVDDYLTTGIHYVIAGIEANDYYTFNLNQSAFVVYKLNTTVEPNAIPNIEVGQKEVITVIVHDTSDNVIPSGFVCITVGDEAHYVKLNSTGGAKINLYELAKGSYINYTVEYIGDDYFNGNSTLVSFNVGVTDEFDMNVIVEDIKYGENATVYVILPNDAKGNVTIYVNDTQYKNITVENGIAKLNVTGLAAGDYIINVTYDGDELYLTKDVNGTPLKVSKADCYPMNVTAIDVTVGVNTTITVHVPKDATGYVTIWVNGTKLTNSTNNGVAIFTLNKTAAGRYTVNATLTDVNYESRNVTTSFWVSKVETPMTITVVNKDNIKVGDNVTVRVTLPEDIVDELVTIEINGVEYTNTSVANVAVFTVPSITYGNKTVVASYGGNDKYVANSTTAQFTVTKRVSQVNVTATGADVGGNAVIEVQVQTNATGYVTVNVNGTNYTINLTDGEGRLEIEGLGNGTYYVHATYLGDDQYKPSTNNTKTFTIINNPSKVNVTATDVVYGNDSVITVKVPTVQTGYVTITVNDTLINVTVKIVNGEAKFNASGLDVGRYRVNVTYLGDKLYLANTNSTYFNITKADLTASAIGLNVTVEENAGIVISVPSDFTGDVKVNVTEIKYNDKVIPLIDIGKFEAGTYTANVTFYGDNNYNNKSIEVRFNVTRVNPVINVTIDDTTYLEKAIAIVNVTGASGVINITVDGKVFNGTLVNGVATIDLEGLSGGGKEALVNFTTSDRHNFNATATAKFTVYRQISSIVIIKENENDVVARITPGTTGNVTFYINGKKLNASIDANGDARLTGVLRIGDNNVVAVYAGDINYTGSQASQNFTVGKTDSLVNVTATTVVYGNDSVITVKVPRAQEGYVTITVNDTLIKVTVEIKNGEAKFNATGLDVGRYIVNVTYLGNTFYDVAENFTYFNITKANLTTSGIGLNVTVKENAGLIITVPDDFDGNVKVNVTDIKYDDKAIPLIDLGKLPAGTYAANVTFHDSKNYNDKSIEVRFTVDRVTPVINVTIDDATYPGKAVAHVNVSDYANGTVNITVDGKVFRETVTNGVATVDLTGLSAGSKVVSVEFFTTDAYNNNATAGAKFTVGKANSTIVIAVENVYVYNDAITIGLTTTGSDGVVSVTINGKSYPVVNGQVVIDRIAAGDYTIIADLAANENYTAASNSTTFKVRQATTSVDIGVESVYYVGEDIEITFTTVNSTDLTVTINGKAYTVDNNKVNIIGGLAAGNYTVNAVLAGNENYTASNDSESFKVVKLQSGLTVNVTDITADQSEIIKVNVTSGATGKVVITVDGKDYYVAIDSGFATLKLGNLTNKTYSVEAKYLGDEKYNGSAGQAIFKVNKLSSSVTVTVENITYGDVAAVNITVITNATGNVTIKIGDEYENTVGVIDGEISVIVPGLTVGDKTVEVTYNGDRVYLPSTDSATFTVAKTTASIEVVVGNVTYGEKVPVTIFVNGTGKVAIEVDGKVIGTPDIVDGKVEYEISGLGAGNYTVKVTYNGNDDINSTTAEAEFEVAKADAEITVEVQDIVYSGVEYIVIKSNAEGNVTVKINGVTKVVELTLNNGRTAVLMASRWAVPEYNGQANVDVSNLEAGKYTVDVTYNGNENYTTAASTAVFNVAKQKTTVDVEVEPSIKAGETQVINITVDNVNATGNVTINIDGVNYTAELKDGKANFTTPVLASGNHTVNVIYDGDKNLTGNWTSKTFEVTKLNAQVDVEISNSTVGGKQTITVTVPEKATGQVLIDIGDKHYYANITEPGKAVLELDDLPADYYTVTATYLGDENYTGGSDSAAFKVTKNNSTVGITTQDIAVGDNEVIIFSVPQDATGNITVKVDGKTYTVAVSGGKGNLTIPKLHRGEYTVNATYNGDDKYLPSNSTATFKVSKQSIEMEVVDEGNRTVVVTLHENATGTVSIKIENETYNATVENGVAVITLTNATPGVHEIDVAYSGDNDYGSQTAKATVHIPKYDTPIKVSVDDIKVGDKAIVVVELPEDATGNVTVEIDGVKYTTDNITGGIARFEIENLTAGNKTIAVVYDDDDNYTNNFTTANMTVEKRTSAITPTINVVDDNLEISVDVPDNATGYVVVEVDNVTYAIKIKDGVASDTISGLSGGNHKVNVTYLGDDQYKASDSYQTTRQVTQVPSTVTVSVDNITYGDKAIVEVTVPGDATGNVTVTIGGKPYTANVSGGKAVIVVPDLNAGNYTVDVTYNGDDKYESSSNTTDLEVSKVKITPDDIKVVDKGNGTVVVVVPDNATGNITIKVGDKNYTAPIVNGTAVVTVDNSTPGNHTVEVIYSGDENTEETSATSTIIAPKYDTPMSIEVGEAKEGEPVVVTVTVPDGASGDVIVSVGGKNYTASIKDGKATVTVDGLSAGDHTVAAEYVGDDNHAANYTISDLTVEKDKIAPDMKVIDQGNGTIAVVVGDNATGNVTVSVDGNNYTVPVVNGTAIVNLDGNVTPGSHEVEIVYSGDDTHNASSVKTTVTGPLVDTPMSIEIGEAKEGEPVVVTVTVPDGASGDVIVSVGGKNYTAPIKDGKATVTVDGLSAGDHTVAAEYAGDGSYAANYTIGNLTVESAKVVPDMKVIDQGNGTIAVVVGDNATGNVTVSVDGKDYTVPVVNGTAIVNLDGNVTPGSHDVEIVYSGDDTHNASSVKTTVTGPIADAPLDITVDDIKVGDKQIIVVNVPEGATGNITVEIDGVKYTQPIKDGKAIFTVDGLTDGKKSAFISYDGDGNYNANTTTAQFSVDKRDAPITATIEDIEVGENLKVTVKLPENATGQVLIDIDGVGYYLNVTNGTGSCEIPRLGSGEYNVTLTYTGDDQYISSSTSNSFKVEKVDSFVIPTASNIVVGENENIKLIVPSDATGNVTVIIDGEEYNFNLDDGSLSTSGADNRYTVAISGGNGELTISGLPKGEYFVSVRYNGDEKYLPSTNTTIFTVSKIDSDVSVVDEGDGTIKVTVPADATGTVTVKVGNETYTANVENGTATIKLDKSAPGTYEIEVTYSGDSDYGSKTVKTTVDVPKHDAPMSSSVNNISVGEDAVITVDVPEGATGTVSVEIDGKTYTGEIKDGKAVIKIPDLTSGNKTAIIKYSGDGNYLENSSYVQFNVSKVDPTFKATPKDIAVGKDETITVTLPEDATGQVLVEINGVGYYADVINGKAKIVIPKLDSGDYTATVTYVGDDKYDSISTSVKFTVKKQSSPISVSTEDINVGDDETVVVKLPKDATGTVTVTVEGKRFTAKVVNGKAEFVIPGLSAGVHDVVVYYSGDSKYNSSTTLTTIKVNDTENGNGTHSDHLHEIDLESEGGIKLSEYPTGNPVLLLLLIILAVGTAQFRRFRK